MIDTSYIQDILWDWFSIAPAEEQIIEFARLDARLWESLQEGGCDTGERECLIQTITEALLGVDQSWPMNMDGDQPEFYVQFAEAARKKGIKLGPAWDSYV